MGCKKLTYQPQETTLKVAHSIFNNVKKTSAKEYLFGYQGSEKDNEVNSSNGSSYTTEFRQLDTRLGRWFSSDPVFQPWQSSYTSMDNNPVNLTDVWGDVAGDKGKPKKESSEKSEKLKARLEKLRISGFYKYYKATGQMYKYNALKEAEKRGVSRDKIKYGKDEKTGRRFAKFNYVEKEINEIETEIKIDGFSDGEYNVDGTSFTSVEYILVFKNKEAIFWGGKEKKNEKVKNNDKSQLINKTTPWLDKAKSQLGVTEISGSQHNPIIISYHATTGGFKDDETPWCSSFANWCFKQTGVKGTNSAIALSWSNWGQSLKNPAYGSLAVINYGGGKGHVGFVVGINSNGSIVLLGGNQKDMVRYSAFKSSIISGYVYPS